MLFDRLPIPARKDSRLSPGAIILLAAIVPKGGPWPDWVELSDTELQEETGQCRSSIQSQMKQLEDAGWIMRVRRRGRRKIHLLFDLAGNKRAQDSGHACTETRSTAPRLKYIHAQEPGQQELREAEPKMTKGATAATSPREGGSPPSPQSKAKTDVHPPEPIDWRKLAAEAGPGNPLAKLFAAMAARGESTSASGSPRRSPEADVEGKSSQSLNYTTDGEVKSTPAHDSEHKRDYR
jgi:DNA-binding MarR family transcriptional regulator